jgi:hypothetical protein
MSSTRTDPRGILLVCQCGNRFLVPHRQAGQRVACTLCGAGLQVPARRSVHQTAADALETEEQKTFWRELVEEEGRAPSQKRSPAIQRPEEKPSWWSDPRRRKKLAVGVIGAACLVVLRSNRCHHASCLEDLRLAGRRALTTANTAATRFNSLRD